MLYDKAMDPAFAGMKADSGEDRVESFPVGAAGLDFGVVCGTDANGILVAGPGTKVRGVSVHSHGCGNRYVQYDCASVMRRGLVWVKVTAAGAVTKDGPVKFAADGTVANAGANTLANASFRSGLTTLGNGAIVAMVELHDPQSELTAAA